MYLPRNPLAGFMWGEVTIVTVGLIAAIVVIVELVRHAHVP